ncbi:MAG: TonB-dependent receptor, partial [Deltaproteobacteria bacterium]|nr:TonB-dependent receptor [Deltaproteobacteria bacterium]
AAHFKLIPIPPPSGVLVVKANIDGALIKIDGKEVGFTPGVIDTVLAGKRKVEVSADGREPVVREVVIKANERAFLETRLRYAQPKVVAAERKLTRAEDAPASITVISGDEIRGFGYATLAEALRSVRGLYDTNERVYDAIGVRGFSTPGTNNNRVLVLNDGHVTNELTYGQGYVGRDFDADLSDVERIEVIRGPGSVLYGSAAFFAVVNLVHRAPPPGLHGRLNVDLESNEGEVGHATLSAADENKYLWLRGAGAIIQGDRFFLSPDATGPYSGIVQDQDKEQAQHADVRARLGEFTLSASLNSRVKQIPTAVFDTFFNVPGTNVWDRRAYVEAAYSHTFESGWGIDVRSAYDNARYKGNWQYLVGQGYDLNSEDWVSGEARIRLPELLKNHIFIGGEVQDRFKIVLESFTPATPFFNNAPGNPLNIPDSESVISAYAGDEIIFSPHFRINAAVRAVNYPVSFGLAVNPRVAVLATPYEGGSTKLMYGSAFRAPGFAERYFTDQVSQAQAVNLQPETIMTGELEHTHQLNDETTILISAYWSRISGLIGFQDVPDGSGMIRYANLPGLTHSAGVETELRWQPSPGAFFELWYAYAHARGTNGQELPNSVEHSGAVRTLLPVIPQVLSFATELIYGSPRRTVADADNPVQEIGESLRWNAGIAGSYNKWNLRYGVYVQNLLNERINLPVGNESPFEGHQVPQPGRIIRVQLSGTF